MIISPRVRWLLFILGFPTVLRFQQWCAKMTLWHCLLLRVLASVRGTATLGCGGSSLADWEREREREREQAGRQDTSSSFSSNKQRSNVSQFPTVSRLLLVDSHDERGSVWEDPAFVRVQTMCTLCFCVPVRMCVVGVASVEWDGIQVQVLPWRLRVIHHWYMRAADNNARILGAASGGSPELSNGLHT